MITTLCAIALLAVARVRPRRLHCHRGPIKRFTFRPTANLARRRMVPLTRRVRLTWSGDVSVRKLFLEAEFLESRTASGGIGCNECYLFRATRFDQRRHQRAKTRFSLFKTFSPSLAFRCLDGDVL